MKKSLSFLLSLALILSMALPASASKLMPGLKNRDTLKETVFRDPDTGITLSIPSDWEIVETEDDPVAKAEFICSEDDTAVIQYGCADMWNELSRSMQKKISREEFDNGMYTLEEIAQLVDTRETYVEYVELDDVEYFRAEVGKKRFFSFKVTATYLIHVENGWMYVYAFRGSDKHDCYDVFESIVSSAVYSLSEPAAEETVPVTTAAPTEAEPTEAEIYADAVDAYEDEKYSQAKQLFESVPYYADSQKYLRLIRIRDYGENTGIGCVYNFSKALTSSEKEEIDEAASDFYFADTAEVLLCNTDVACYYLFGNWITASNSSPYAYFKLHKDASGGYYYTRSSNLSKAVSDCVSIIDGDVRISITSSNTLVFHIDLTAPDCMEIYSYETCSNFTLYR